MGPPWQRETHLAGDAVPCSCLCSMSVRHTCASPPSTRICSGVLEAALSLVRRRRSVVVDADMSMPDLFRRCVRMAGSLQCRVVVLEAESASSDEDTEPTGGQG